MDGSNGLRNKVGLNQLKSVDYIIIHTNKDISFIEFSDLLTQITNLQQKSNNLYDIIQSVVRNYIKCDLQDNDPQFTKRDITKITKGCISVIGNELTAKFKDTYLTLKYHSSKNDIKNLKYFIVYNDAVNSDIMILDLIKFNIISSIPKSLCLPHNIIFKPLSQFNKEIRI
ncbi:hypothetical protein [Rodentibacter trehalosifermentans]|uniref:hypothetical protein n=1 Tax=Rodentibacter trehalosifermentans TaxID=1908263 RepID=UPI0009871764|nr:hypothetical protein [Rodentibacter trehalosifermentans]OOF45953.1 hypothetical protein BKK53_12060 [Rodentibacter trehalosifermentans]